MGRMEKFFAPERRKPLKRSFASDESSLNVKSGNIGNGRKERRGRKTKEAEGAGKPFNPRKNAGICREAKKARGGAPRIKLRRNLEGMTTKQLHQAFKALDADDSGSISAAEFANLIRKFMRERNERRGGKTCCQGHR